MLICVVGSVREHQLDTREEGSDMNCEKSNQFLADLSQKQLRADSSTSSEPTAALVQKGYHRSETGMERLQHTANGTLRRFKGQHLNVSDQNSDLSLIESLFYDRQTPVLASGMSENLSGHMCKTYRDIAIRLAAVLTHAH